MLEQKDKTRLLSLYLGADLDCTIIAYSGITAKTVTAFNIDILHNAHKLTNDVQLKLRPLSSLTPSEALAITKFVHREDFGDYRYDKWISKEQKTYFKDGTVMIDSYIITRNKSETWFEVDKVTGEISCYPQGDRATSSQNVYYAGWYYERGFDLPTYPTGKTMYELGLAYY